MANVVPRDLSTGRLSRHSESVTPTATSVRAESAGSTVRVHDRPDCAVIDDLSDKRRAEPSFVLGEREMLEAWLEFHRTTLLLKCEGLSDSARKQQPVPTSRLSLHGLVRHAAEGERNWFQRNLLRNTTAPFIWADAVVEDREFAPLDGADWATDLDLWTAECAQSRAAAAALELDDVGLRHGRPCSLRWVYVHAIEEYARHNGHADIIREMVDGAVGW